MLCFVYSCWDAVYHYVLCILSTTTLIYHCFPRTNKKNQIKRVFFQFSSLSNSTTVGIWIHKIINFHSFDTTHKKSPRSIKNFSQTQPPRDWLLLYSEPDQLTGCIVAPGSLIIVRIRFEHTLLEWLRGAIPVPCVVAERNQQLESMNIEQSVSFCFVVDSETTTTCEWSAKVDCVTFRENGTIGQWSYHFSIWGCFLLCLVSSSVFLAPGNFFNWLTCADGGMQRTLCGIESNGIKRGNLLCGWMDSLWFLRKWFYVILHVLVWYQTLLTWFSKGCISSIW